MWLLHVVLGALTILGNRPTTRPEKANGNWLDSMTGTGVFAGVPAGKFASATGRATLTFHVRDLRGSPLDDFRIILSSGSATLVRLITSSGKASVTLSWNELPVQQRLRIRVMPATKGPFSVEAVMTSAIKEKIPQLGSHVPPRLFTQKTDRFLLMFDFPPAQNKSTQQ